MNISPTIDLHRRRHAPEFKQGLVALCRPSISVSAVAISVTNNMLQRILLTQSFGIFYIEAIRGWMLMIDLRKIEGIMFHV